jgi:hypothetical protein
MALDAQAKETEMLMVKMMKLKLALILLPVLAFAQSGTFKMVDVVTDYDLDSTSEIYVATGNTGVADGSGVFPVSRYDKFTVSISVTQSDSSAGIDARILCRTTGAAPWLQLYPDQTPGATTPTYVNIATIGAWGKEVSGTFFQCRVGMLHHGTDPSDAGANVEKVSITLSSRT